jgi:hypothetical protein
VSAMVMPIDFKTTGCQRACNVVVSAKVLAHAMDKYDDGRARSRPVGSPAIADKLPAVG